MLRLWFDRRDVGRTRRLARGARSPLRPAGDSLIVEKLVIRTRDCRKFPIKASLILGSSKSFESIVKSCCLCLLESASVVS